MADDLTSIRGIGVGRAQALSEEFGVRTYAELAALDPDAVVAAFRTRRQALSRETAALWIAEAERRSRVRPEGWVTTALFVVYYEQRGAERRTTARRADTNTDAQWPEHVTTEMAAWVAAQLSLPAGDTGTQPGDTDAPAGGTGAPGAGAGDTGGEHDAASAEPPAARDAELVTALRLYDPPDAGTPHTVDDDGNLHHIVRAGRPVAIELTAGPGVAPPHLAVRTASVGVDPRTSWDWTQTPAAAGAGTARVVVGGLPEGLYRLIVTAEPEHLRQVGPLVLVE